MTGSEIIGGIVVTAVGGFILYWATTGYQERQQNEEHAREVSQQNADHAREVAQQEADRKAKEQAAQDDAKKHARHMSELEADTNRNGSDYRDYVAPNIDDCLQACVNETACKAITFNRTSRQCWMKTAVPLRSTWTGFTSSVVVGGR